MKNSPVKHRNIGTLAKLILAGVFLVAAFVLPMAFRASTMAIPGAGTGSATPVAVSANTNLLGGFTAVVERAFGGGHSSVGADTAVAAGEGTAGAVAPVQSSSLPAKLVIPSLGINSDIQYVGLTSDGNMDTPKSAVDVAWYKLGPKPGDIGNAVIAGHINTRYSAHGVFEHLDDLSVGDTVNIVTKGGATLAFRVTGKEDLPYDASGATVFGKTSGRHLNLITCAGTWQKDLHVYDKRLVIYTELIQ